MERSTVELRLLNNNKIHINYPMYVHETDLPNIYAEWLMPR